MNILYLHPSGAFGGAGRSLIELWNALPTPKPKGFVLAPRGGVIEAFSAAGLIAIPCLGLSQFDNTIYGRYKGVRWLVLLKEIFLLPFSIFSIVKLRSHKIDIVHANEITLLPIAIFAKWFLCAQLIVHVRSGQQKEEATPLRTMLIGYLLRKYADKVVSIDETVARTLPENVISGVIHNGLRLEGDCSQPYPEGAIRVGSLGVFVRQKGIHILISAISILKNRNVAVKCLIGGENIRNPKGVSKFILQFLGVSGDIRAELEELVAKYDLVDDVVFLGRVKNVENFYSKIDVLCFPSLVNAAGRPVFEAALLGRPCVVAIKNPPKDSIIHGKTGFAIDGPDPIALADAIEAYARDPEMTRHMGENARAWAQEYFSIEKSGRELAAVYASLVATEKTP